MNRLCETTTTIALRKYNAAAFLTPPRPINKNFKIGKLTLVEAYPWSITLRFGPPVRWPSFRVHTSARRRLGISARRRALI